MLLGELPKQYLVNIVKVAHKLFFPNWFLNKNDKTTRYTAHRTPSWVGGFGTATFDDAVGTGKSDLGPPNGRSWMTSFLFGCSSRRVHVSFKEGSSNDENHG